MDVTRTCDEILKTLESFGIVATDVRIRANIESAIENALSDEDMSLRDHFAANAPITTKDAMLACGVPSVSIGMLPRAERIAVMTALAEMRAEYADAMLERRAQ